jgi:hypothetical protein
VQLWVNEAKRGRMDLSTIASPRRESDEDLTVVIDDKLDIDSQLSAMKLV